MQSIPIIARAVSSNPLMDIINNGIGLNQPAHQKQNKLSQKGRRKRARWVGDGRRK